MLRMVFFIILNGVLRTTFLDALIAARLGYCKNDDK